MLRLLSVEIYSFLNYWLCFFVAKITFLPSAENLYDSTGLHAKNDFSFLSEAYMCRGELAARENQTDNAISFYGKASIPQASFCQVGVAIEKF